MKGGETTRVTDVHYSRTFAGNNDEPREHIGQYENEKIGITIEATEDHEGPQILFEKAMETVHQLQEDAVRFRQTGTKRSRIQELKEELERLETETEDEE